MQMKYFLMIILWAAISVKTQAQSTEYLDDFPSPKEVLNKINHDDLLESYTMKIGALQHLAELIDRLAGKRLFREGLTKDEVNLKSEYMKTCIELRDFYHNNIQKLEGSAEKEWRKRCWNYTGSLATRVNDELLGPGVKTMFSKISMEKKNAAVARKRQDSINKVNDERAATEDAIENKKQSEKHLMQIAALLICFGGGVLLLFGAFRVKHRLQRYEFENRIDGGAVQFSSYKASLRHHRKKAISDYIMMFAILLLVAGCFVLGNL